MSYAPFNSTDKVLGCFRDEVKGNFFEFTEATSPKWKNFAVKIWLTADQFRYGRVYKNVAHVVTGEDKGGNPMYEKWDIKNQRFY